VNITVTGRKTKKKFSTPVWFVLEGEHKVLLVPNTGSDNYWFKDLVVDPQIELTVDENAISSKAKLLRDSDHVEKILEKFRAKYRSMWSESYYTKRDVYEVPLENDQMRTRV
jgi:hypothetical protein